MVYLKKISISETKNVSELKKIGEGFRMKKTKGIVRERISVQIDAKMKEWMEEQAMLMGVSVSAFANIVFSNFRRESEQKKVSKG